MMCAEDGLTVIADLLIGSGADPHIVNCNNETAYSLAFNRNHINILQLLQEDPSKYSSKTLISQLLTHFIMLKILKIDVSNFSLLTD